MELGRSSENVFGNPGFIRSPIENVWKKLAVHGSVCSDAANSKGQPSVRQSHQFGVIFTPTCHIDDAFL